MCYRNTYAGIVWWVLMVTLPDPDFLSLTVTVLQTADRGNTHNTLPYGFRRYQYGEWKVCIKIVSHYVCSVLRTSDNETTLIRYHFFIHTRIIHPVGRPFTGCFKCPARSSLPLYTLSC